jgi:hypothetical protein
MCRRAWLTRTCAERTACFASRANPRSSLQVLLCVADDGGIFPYSVDGELLPWQLSLGAECAAQRVAEACVLPTGVVALTQEAQLFAVRRCGAQPTQQSARRAVALTGRFRSSHAVQNR